ncbi:myc protein [Drosophila busckii]|uniref:myc protein n=1 Tax=Drosophila busckii TaxID=30019 RepID=UPI001432C138|nr:myc protein [Drosophila busckii]
MAINIYQNPYDWSQNDLGMILNDDWLDGMDDIDMMRQDEELMECSSIPSIKRDVDKIETDQWASLYDQDHDLFDELDSKAEVRNGGIMWSMPSMGNSANNNSNGNNNGAASNWSSGNSENNNSAASSYCESSAVPPSIVTGSCNAGTVQIKREPIDIDDDEQEEEEDNNNSSRSSSSKPTATPTINIPTTKSNTAAALRRNLANNYSYKTQLGLSVSPEYIPPGTSLLRRSNLHYKQQKLLQKQQQLEQQLEQQRLIQAASNCLRPDTPHSAYDDNSSGSTLVKRHNVDLRACVMGSNNMPLTAAGCDANKIINELSLELQNTSKDRMKLPMFNCLQERRPSYFEDVIAVIADSQPASNTTQTGATQQSQTMMIDDAAAAATLSPPATTATSSDCDSDDGEYSMVAKIMEAHHMRHISDHSYTRCTELENNLETPSDSDEEIDVVSVNDKKLPTNPSDRDRRALQTKVAHKISGGVAPRVVHAIRRNHYDLPYTPASNSPVKLNGSRYTSPPHNAELLLQSSSISSSSSSSSSRSSSSSCSSSDNSSANSSSSSSSSSTLSPKHNSSGSGSGSSVAGGAGNLLKRQLSLDEADTIEKRNLHNDMERQRRIGLKNLFEALKKQIPNIRDKERAPKVNILREAAKLCEQLTKEEYELSVKCRVLKAKVKQQQERLARLRLSRHVSVE